jgi:tyrosyl-tRNA synthetase
MEGVTVHAITYPLLTTASGAKMGKTASGAVWLDADKLSPYDFYQYWVNCDDRDVEKLLKTFTFLPLAEISRLAALEGADIREAKRVLAFEATTITHGRAAAEEAEAGAKAAFSGEGSAEAMPSTTLPLAQLTAGLSVVDAFVLAGLAKSKGEARRMAQQGGMYLNDNRVNSLDDLLTEADLTAEGLILRAGKKKYHRLVFE